MKSLLAAVLAVATLSASQAGPSFDVASVKPTKSDAPGPTGFMPPLTGNYTATARTLRELIQGAYGLRPFQVIGGPAWIGSERFDIVAKAEGTFPPDILPEGMLRGPSRQLFLMLQALLRDRFQLAVHTETRELPIYALVLARPDGRLGPKLTKTEFDCASYLATVKGGATVPPAPPVAGQGKLPLCFVLGGGPPGLSTSGRLMGRGLMLAHMAAMQLPSLVERVVVDRTGLNGYYDLDLEWSANPNGDGPSLFTALQEQLGLKLESTKGPVDVLVVDNAERPTEN